jgi:hypothetical protein
VDDLEDATDAWVRAAREAWAAVEAALRRRETTREDLFSRPAATGD